MPNTTTVTFNDVLDDTDYQPRPGVQYEIAEGVIVTMKRPTTKLLKDFDTYGQAAEVDEDGEAPAVTERFESAAREDGEHFTDALLAKAQMVTDAPDSFGWEAENVDPVVLQRLCEDFLSLCIVRSRMLAES